MHKKTDLIAVISSAKLHFIVHNCCFGEKDQDQATRLLGALKMLFPFREIIFLLLISIAYADSAQAEKIFTWKDEQGNTHFGDKPAGKRAKEVKIKSTSVGTGSGEQRTERTKKFLDALTEDRQEREQAREKAKLEKQARAKKCAAAKKSLQEVSDAQYVYTESESGEKNILGFEQRAAEEQKAANKVREFCGKN